MIQSYQTLPVSAQCPECKSSLKMHVSPNPDYAYHCDKCHKDWKVKDITKSDTNITRKEENIGPAHLIYAIKNNAANWIKSNETQMSLIASKAGAISYGSFPLTDTVFMLFGNTEDSVVTDENIQSGAKLFAEFLDKES